jgi:hypothetical protein
MVVGAEKVDEAGVGAEASESMSSSSSPGRRAWLVGECKFLVLCRVLRPSLPLAASAGEAVTPDECSRSDLSSLPPRLRPDMDSLSLTNSDGFVTEAHRTIQRLSRCHAYLCAISV